MTARDSIGHVERGLFGKSYSNVHGGSVSRVSVFHAKVMGSNLDLVLISLYYFFSSF